MSRGSARSGGRSKRVVDAVLRATIDQLAVDGWADLRIEAVAARAGVHKTTIYRRWPTRGTLVAAALAATPFRALRMSVPDTGSLAGDITALIEDFATVWIEPRTRAVAKTLAAARDDPEVAEAWSTFWRAQIDQVTAVVRQAMARGEAGPDADPDLVAEVYLGTVYLHVLELEREITQPWISRLAAAVVAASQASLPQPGRRR
jgi:AcrR family transcriptional regulator